MELLLVIVFVFFPLCILVGVAGKNRNIGFWGAFWISFFFSPIVGILFTLISSKKRKADPYEELKKLEYLKSQNMIDDKKYEEKKAQIKALISKAMILVVSNILFLSCNLVETKSSENIDSLSSTIKYTISTNPKETTIAIEPKKVKDTITNKISESIKLIDYDPIGRSISDIQEDFVTKFDKEKRYVESEKGFSILQYDNYGSYGDYYGQSIYYFSIDSKKCVLYENIFSIEGDSDEDIQTKIFIATKGFELKSKSKEEMIFTRENRFLVLKLSKEEITRIETYSKEKYISIYGK